MTACAGKSQTLSRSQQQQRAPTGLASRWTLCFCRATPEPPAGREALGVSAHWNRKALSGRRKWAQETGLTGRALHSGSRNSFYCFISFFSIFIFLGRWEGEREGNIKVQEQHQSAASSMNPNQGPNLQPRHVPRPGIELATFQFTG